MAINWHKIAGIDRGPVFDRGRGSPNLTGAGDFLTDNFKTTKIVMNEIMAIFFQNSSNLADFGRCRGMLFRLGLGPGPRSIPAK